MTELISYDVLAGQILTVQQENGMGCLHNRLLTSSSNHARITRTIFQKGIMHSAEIKNSFCLARVQILIILFVLQMR